MKRRDFLKLAVLTPVIPAAITEADNIENRCFAVTIDFNVYYKCGLDLANKIKDWDNLTDSDHCYLRNMFGDLLPPYDPQLTKFEFDLWQDQHEIKQCVISKPLKLNGLIHCTLKMMLFNQVFNQKWLQNQKTNFKATDKLHIVGYSLYDFRKTPY